MSTRGEAGSAYENTHPAWCIQRYCTANRKRSGAHRSAPIIVSEAPFRITVNLYAAAALPDAVLVEAKGIPILLPAKVAYQVGRVLVSIGHVVEQESSADS